MISKIATPIADETTSKRILKEVLKKDKNLISGIKPCHKKIVGEDKSKSICVFNAAIQPIDLIIHLPILCEENNIPYFFVKDKKWINNKTCVFLNELEDERYKKIVDKI